VIINKYAIQEQNYDGSTIVNGLVVPNSSYNSGDGFPSDFTLQCSNYDISWKVLDSRTNISPPGINNWTPNFTFENGTAYRYYKLVITAIKGGLPMPVSSATSSGLVPIPIPVPEAPSVISTEVSFDNAYMVAGFVSASMFPGTPFVDLATTVMRYDQTTINAVLSLLRLCFAPDTPSHQVLENADDMTSTIQSIGQTRWTDINNYYCNWNRRAVSTSDNPSDGSIWSGSLVLGHAGSQLIVGDFKTQSLRGTVDLIDQLTVTISSQGYKYLRAASYSTPFIPPETSYTIEWLNDSPDVVSSNLYKDGFYCGNFSPSGSFATATGKIGTRQIWLVSGLDSLGAVIKQMWFMAVAR
jgi:hypothetical protein